MPESTIARIAAARGRRVWLVGGPVRDALLGRSGGDLDLALDGAVQEIGRAASRRLGGGFRWHPRFLTGRIEFSAVHIDLARTRRETYDTPAALPRVRPGSLEQDLARRDFSVNAMALEILPQATGALEDPFNGRADLDSRLLRVLHPDSFLDDPTRAFRALRFGVRLGFRLEPATGRWMREAIARAIHERLSGERVAAELRLALDEERPAAVLTAFHRAGLASFWGGEGASERLRHAPRRLAGFGVPPDDRRALLFGVAFAHLGTRRREGIVRALRLRRPEKRALTERPGRARELLGRVAASRGRIALDRVCSQAGAQDLILAALLADAATHGRIAGWWRGARQLELRIDGQDLRRAGVRAGPGIARGLVAARSALLGGHAPDRRSQLRAALLAAGRT